MSCSVRIRCFTGKVEKLTPEEKARRERMRLSAGGFASFQLDESGRFVLLPLSGKLFVFDRVNATTRELKTPSGTIIDPKWSHDSKWIAYVRDNDVYVYELSSDHETAVTRGGTIIKTHGLAEFVAQEEMGRFSGYWWSPDSKFIAFEEADHEGVETWYVADPSKPDQKPLQQYYPRPGKKNVRVRLGIVPISGGDPIWVDWDHKAYEYLASVRWDKHGPLTIQVQDRRQHEIVLLRVDPATGKTRKLLEEKDPAFTNLRQDMPRWLPGATHFSWISEYGKSPGLELRRADGSLSELLVPFGEGLISVEHADLEIAYVASTDPTQAHAYVRMFPLQIDTNGKELIRPRRPFSDKPIRLGEGHGLESVVFSENKGVYVLTRTSLDGMPHSFVYTRNRIGWRVAVGGRGTGLQAERDDRRSRGLLYNGDSASRL